MLCIRARLLVVPKKVERELGFTGCGKIRERKGTGLPVPLAVSSWWPSGPSVRLFQSLPLQYLKKTVPQRLKPLYSQGFTARVNPCPSVRCFFPQPVQPLPCLILRENACPIRFTKYFGTTKSRALIQSASPQHSLDQPQPDFGQLASSTSLPIESALRGRSAS